MAIAKRDKDLFSQSVSEDVYKNTVKTAESDKYDGGSAEATVTVDKQGGPKLPDTGGTGKLPVASTTGLIIMCGAAGVIIYRKKRKPM